MAILQSGLWQRCVWQLLSMLIFSSLAIPPATADPNAAETESWRREQLKKINRQMEDAGSPEERLEYAARASWLRRWQPGRMPSSPTRSSIESSFVDEPTLHKLKKPAGMPPQVWQEMVWSQTELLKIDTD